MGTINNRFQYVWYGTCGEQEKCKPYVFKDNPAQLTDAVEMISSFTTNSVNNSILYYKPEEDEGDLTSMECGGMYSITLKAGKTLNIPGITAAGSETIKVGDNELPSKISFTCADVFEITPSPTEAECIPDSFTKVRIVSINQSANLNGNMTEFALFTVDDLVGIDFNHFQSALASSVMVTLPNDVTSQIVFTGLEPKSEGSMLYVEKENSCFGGEYEKINGSWQVNLKLLSGLDVTPVSQPTPTPEPSCDCAPSGFTNVTMVEPVEVNGSVQYIGFEQGMVISLNSSTLKSEGIGTMVELLFPNDTTMGTLVLTGVVPNNTQFFVKHGNVCYSAVGSSSNRGTDSNWKLKTVISQTLPSSCGETTIPTPMPTPTPKPTPSPSPKPTPTPEPQPTSCTPTGYTALTTNGVITPPTRVDESVNGTLLTFFDYQGFEDGGTLSVDLTLTSSSVELEDIVQPTIISLGSASNQVGTVRKLLKNGNDRNMIYYKDLNGKCWSGQYVLNEMSLILT